MMQVIVIINVLHQRVPPSQEVVMSGMDTKLISIKFRIINGWK